MKYNEEAAIADHRELHVAPDPVFEELYLDEIVEDRERNRPMAYWRRITRNELREAGLL